MGKKSIRDSFTRNLFEEPKAPGVEPPGLDQKPEKTFPNDWNADRDYWNDKMRKLNEEINHCAQCDIYGICPRHNADKRALEKEGYEREFLS